MPMHGCLRLADSDGSSSGKLRDMTIRCCWNLAATHPVVAARLVDLGLASLLMATAASTTAGSCLARTAVHAILHLTTMPKHLPALGGLLDVCRLLCTLIARGLQGAAPHGQGADVELVEDATRGLARIGLSLEGRAALKASKAAKSLIAVVRMDIQALETVIQLRRSQKIPEWQQVEALFCPLRAINGLTINLPPEQRKAAHELAVNAWRTAHPPSPALERSGVTSPSHSRPASRAATCTDIPDLVQLPDQDTCTGSAGSGQAELGLLALWGLLNLSTYAPAQTSICKHGLYSLLRAVHRSTDPMRSTTAASVLANIHFHPDNSTTLYRAELKLKHAALLQVIGGYRSAYYLSVRIWSSALSASQCIVLWVCVCAVSQLLYIS
jgi:hypothetical protein